MASKWRPARRITRRRAQEERCGTRCFLDPLRLRYPVCPKRKCTPSCQGALAAYKRARQQREQKIARAAVKLGKRRGCAWAKKH